jgi:hypothetical protein
VLSEKILWKGEKKIQTQVSHVTDDTTTIRSLDWDRDRFDIEFGLQVREFGQRVCMCVCEFTALAP